MKTNLLLIILGLLLIGCGSNDGSAGEPPTISIAITSGGNLEKTENKVAFIERTGGNVPVKFSFTTPGGYDRSTYRSQFTYGPAFLNGAIDIENDKLSGTFSVEYVGPVTSPTTGEEATFAVFDQFNQKDSLTIFFTK